MSPPLGNHSQPEYDERILLSFIKTPHTYYDYFI